MQQAVWMIIGCIGFLGYLPSLPPELRLLNIAFAVPLAIRLVSRLRTRPEAISEKPTSIRHEPLPPTSGGAPLMMLRYQFAMLLCFVVPTMLIQIIRQMRGEIQAVKRAVDSIEAYQQKTRYRLPFDGRWYVVNGGITKATSHSWDIVGQRYAYDFVVTDDALRRWRSDGRHLSDYLCYHLPILAPADGEVITVVDGVRDAPGVGTGWVDVFTPHFPGNMVTIQHAEGEYSTLAHLIPGSICVRNGERVRQGQMIGRCGHSGHSTEPHLHFQVQDRPDFFGAASVPIAFDSVSVNAEPGHDGVYVTQGTHVQHT